MKKILKQILLPLTLFSIVACQSKEQVLNLNRLITPTVNKISNKERTILTEESLNSYCAFTRKFTSLVMETAKSENEESSLAISLPDAYLSLAILGLISDDEARDDILSYLEVENQVKLKNVVRQILSTFCTLYQDENGNYSGGYNLNSIWLNPDLMQLVEEKDEELYQDLEKIYDVSTYYEALTSTKANQYLKDNCLPGLPTPKIELDDSNPSGLSLMSIYSCLDFFNGNNQTAYSNQFKSGSHKMNYSYGNTNQQVDYIEKTQLGVIFEGTNFSGVDFYINNLKMSVFLPENASIMPSSILDDVLQEKYKYEETISGCMVEPVEYNTHISVPYFSLNNKIELKHEILNKVLPIITTKGAGARLAQPLVEGQSSYLDSIKQFSVMKFNYDGFYSCSATISEISPGGAAPDSFQKYDFIADHPFVFEVKKHATLGTLNYQLPIVVGEIINPNYQD